MHLFSGSDRVRGCVDRKSGIVCACTTLPVCAQCDSCIMGFAASVKRTVWFCCIQVYILSLFGEGIFCTGALHNPFCRTAAFPLRQPNQCWGRSRQRANEELHCLHCDLSTLCHISPLCMIVALLWFFFSSKVVLHGWCHPPSVH